MSAWYGLIATVCGLGAAPRMAGALGCLPALALFLLMGRASVLLILFLAAAGIIAADRYSRAVSADDPEEIVIDEAVGFLAAMWGFGRNYALVGFFLYRIIDIVKPFPARLVSRIPRGVGVMADDLWCGVVTNVLMRLAEWLFFGTGAGS
jgi:phosphatidylglycerophosphatase A